MSDRIHLREFIVHATGRWPVLVLFCLAGSLLGWGISFLLPPAVRATAELYVGLNVATHSGENQAASLSAPQFVNADDFKNWQMANLNALVYMDEILDGTLTRLRDIDPYWDGISRNQLRKSLSVYWRNAGKWRLVAQGDDRLRVAQAVAVWEYVIVERVHQAVAAAEQLQSINKELEGLSLASAQIVARLVKLDYLNQTLQTRWDQLGQLEASAIVNENDRWALWQPVAQAGLGEVWNLLSESFPASGALPQDYSAWIDQAQQAIDLERQALIAQKEQLESDKAHLASLYSESAETSLGLSENLEVESITTGLPQFSVIRPTSSLVLIGMLLGLIFWVGYWLVVYSLADRP